MSWLKGFLKVAVIDLPDEAKNISLATFQDRVQGSQLQKDTGQARGRATRTFNVQNEDKQFKKSLRHDWSSSRAPAISGLKE